MVYDDISVYNSNHTEVAHDVQLLATWIPALLIAMSGGQDDPRGRASPSRARRDEIAFGALLVFLVLVWIGTCVRD
jgi:hypothetical protein